MSTIDKTKLDGYLAPVRYDEVTPEHRAWMNEKTKATLKRKARGEVNYTPLNKVRRDFGLDAS